MKKLYVKNDKIIKKVMKNLSGTNDDFISVKLKPDSKYIKENIEELNDLLSAESEDLNYLNEYSKMGLKVVRFLSNGKTKLKLEYSNRLFEVVSDYIFMVLPDERSYFSLIPFYIYPLVIDSYDELVQIMPDVINYMIENDYAYVDDVKIKEE